MGGGGGSGNKVYYEKKYANGNRKLNPQGRAHFPAQGLEFEPIECFHSRGQHLCKFIGTKESVCIRKEFNSHRISLGHQHGRGSTFPRVAGDGWRVMGGG